MFGGFMREGEDFLKTYPVTAVLFLINVIMFLLMEFTGEPGNTDTVLRLGASYTPYIHDGQYWRLVTSCFLHFGIGHLVNNMIALVAVGSILEVWLGRVRYFIFYMISGLAGSILTYSVELLREEKNISAGASGAIFGLIGIYAILLLKNRSRLGRGTFLRVVFGVTLAVLPGFYNKGISLTAHLGGLLAGILMGLTVRAPEKSVNSPKDSEVR